MTNVVCSAASTFGGRGALGGLAEGEGALGRVLAAIDKLIEVSRPFKGLFLSVIDLGTGEIPFNLPSAIAGQRECDRSFPGSNLMHDHVVLKVMYDLSGVLGEARWAAAGDRYLERFATHCTDTPTGLFPWGEHAFWNLMEDRPGSSYALARVATMATHDHLQQAPGWLWEKLWALNPAAVERYCQGLSRHFLDVEPLEYNRHANLLEPHHLKRSRGVCSCDFPRHSGFHIFDWSFAYARTGSPLYRRYLERSLDYWWERRQGGRMLRLQSRSAEPGQAATSTSQTMSLALSVLESAALAGQRDAALADLMQQRGEAYLDSVMAAPHELDRGLVALSVDAASGQATSYAPIWGSSYGAGVLASSLALLALGAYRLKAEPRLLDFAERVGRCCAGSEMPSGEAIPVKDAGMQLSLLADLYSLTGERKWLLEAQRWAGILVPLFVEGDLPRGAIGLGIYESQLLPGHLLRGLARIALLSSGQDIGPDYTLR